MARLILVRHGETDWNVDGRIQGHHDRPLNERGLAQAEMVGRYVRDHFDVQTTWSSDLSRCTQTAAGLGATVQPTETIREVNFGDWEGQRWEDINGSNPELAAQFSSRDPEVRPPGGESIRDVIARARRFVEEAAIFDADVDVAVVAHGGSLKCLLIVLLGLPESAFGRFHFSNCGVSVVGAGNGPATLMGFNHTSHLEGAAPTT